MIPTEIQILVNFWVNMKVFTPCLGVLHEIWGTCCKLNPWMVLYGL